MNLFKFFSITFMFSLGVLLPFSAASAYQLQADRNVTLNELRQAYSGLESVHPEALPADFRPTHYFDLNVVVLENNSWTLSRVNTRVINAAAVFLQCGTQLRNLKVYTRGPRSFNLLFTDMNIITDPTGNQQTTQIGRSLTDAGLTNRPTLLYVEEQTKTKAGVSFPSRPGGRLRNRLVPYRDVDYAIIPYIYERSSHLVPAYISADYSGEAHELGHIFSLTHENRSPLMHVDPVNAARGIIYQQNNELNFSACSTVKRSHLVQPVTR